MGDIGGQGPDSMAPIVGDSRYGRFGDGRIHDEKPAAKRNRVLEAPAARSDAATPGRPARRSRATGKHAWRFAAACASMAADRV